MFKYNTLRVVICRYMLKQTIYYDEIIFYLHFKYSFVWIIRKQQLSSTAKESVWVIELQL